MMKVGKLLAVMAVLLMVLSGISFADEIEAQGVCPPPPDGQCTDTDKHEVCVQVKQVCEIKLGPGVTLHLDGSDKGAKSGIEHTTISWAYSGSGTKKAKITAYLQGTFPNVTLEAKIDNSSMDFKAIGVGPAKATTLYQNIGPSKVVNRKLSYRAIATGNVPDPKQCRDVIYTLTDK
jgi:hypothetical protein